MYFSANQINLAIKLKAAGLEWNPMRGQFVFDAHHKIKIGSPFQPHVYYFHDFQCFVDYFGSIQELNLWLTWLPTFEESRELVGDLRQFDKNVRESLGDNLELEAIYHQLLTELGPNP